MSLSPSGGRGDRSSAIAQAAQLKILVVDDDDYVHVALRAALRSLRADIFRAGTAAEGFELARSHRPDLAIIDLGLPDAHGYQLTRWLRSTPELDGLGILIVTGHLPDAVAAAEAGADEILAKPFSLGESLEAVRRQVRKRALVK